MSAIRQFFKTLKSLLLVLVLASWQTAFAIGPLLSTPTASAIVNDCVVDTAGANDEPNQKDLTELCVDDTAGSSIHVTWGWDEIKWTGANTGDACALFDTDSDGKVNYSICVSIDGNPAEQISSSPRIFSCGDDKPDRCTTPQSELPAPYASRCSVTQEDDDPFTDGDDSPADTVADCTLVLSDVGDASAELIDVCSYPSLQPNSDPSDCVIIKDSTAFITLIKQVEPETDPGRFNLLIDGQTHATDVVDNGTTGVVNVDASGGQGTVFNVSETAGTNTSLASYNSTVQCTVEDKTGTPTVGNAINATSTNVTLKPAEEAICTFTNTRQQATLILQKTVVNDDGGTLTQSSFPVAINGTTAAWGSNTVSPGTYTVSETSQPGYQPSVWGGNCDANGNVTLADSQTMTCTITNDDIPPELGVTKRVLNDNGGDKLATDFTLLVNGIEQTDARKGGGDVADSSVTYLVPDTDAGVTYTLSEEEMDGYAQTSLVCVDRDTDEQVSHPVTLALGQKVECTITNGDIAPTLTLVKNVTNDNGGTAAADDWALTAAPADNQYQTISGDGTATGDAQAGVSYGLSEAGPDGYAASNWNCDGGTLVGSDITLEVGDTVTCSITNDDIPPRLTIIKVVTNDDGGQLEAGDFPLYVDDIQVTSGTEYTSFDAGTYSVTEDQQDGYSFVDFTGDCLADGTITLVVGGVYTCYVNNDDQPVHITVTKQVTNDDGGTAGVGDFDLYVNSTQVTSGVDNTFPANVEYTVSEIAQVDGYDQTSLTCTDQDQNDLGSTFTPTNGDSVTCVIVNDDVAPKLKLVKTVTNDNGGTASEDNFQAKIDGNNVDWDQDVTLAAGSYTASELALAGGEGYGASDWTGDCAADGSITLSLRDEAVCYITNDDIAPQLTVIKTVVNDNFGTATPGEFTMNVDGTNVSDPSFPGDASGTTVTLNVGEYNVTEDAFEDYTPSYSADCTGTIALGETKTCTVTNDDDPDPSIGVVKDGPATAYEGDLVTYTFVVTNTGDTVLNDVNISDDIATGEICASATLNPGQSTNCSATYVIPTPQVADVVNTVTACGTSPEDVEVCNTDTHTLDVLHPTITVNKVVEDVSESGDTFNLQIDGTTEAADVGDGGTTGAVNVTPGAHTVGETGSEGVDLDDYDVTISGDCAADGSVTVVRDESAECTITNTRHANVTVTKFNDLNRNGEMDDDEPVLPNWVMNLDCQNELETDAIATCDDQQQSTGSDGVTIFEHVTPDEDYVLSESLEGQAGWFWSSTYCDDKQGLDGDNQYFLSTEPGEEVTCFVGNYREPVLNLAKFNDSPDPVDNGDTVTYTLAITLPANSGASFDTTVVDLPPEGFTYVPGSWTAIVEHEDGTTEDLKAGGTTTEPTYASPGTWLLGNLLPGDEVTLTYRAVVGSAVSPGTYPDIAFAYGCSTDTEGCDDENIVYSNVHLTGDDPFDGTEVTIAGRVLGVSDTVVLVNTGTGLLWAIVTTSILLLAAGVFAARAKTTTKGGRA
jgi:uncharacterized repeat protein (TIGR01451 family)